ncbi:DNA-binding response regulator [bacterium D16-51]|nr:DNA-binding response regulator [bacterium D16-59]RKI59530.1 DNA-binding response regulator [bacterium D16-51]
MKIQIVEDDVSLNQGIALALKEENFSFVQCNTVRQAKEAYAAGRPDLIILDINLPDGSGYDYLKWVREKEAAVLHTQILVLTANDMEMDEVMSLSLGADDYMSKPFSLAVLRARVNNLGQRMSRELKENEVYKTGRFSFDFNSLHFECRGKKISLSVNEQKLLKLFVRNEERILTREILMEQLWEDGAGYVDENALSVMVNRLRSKLVQRGEASPIQTVYGQGYLWARQKGREQEDVL